MKLNQTLGFQDVPRFLDGLFDGDLHAKRVLSLANATLGVIRTAALAVHTIGQGLALARGLVTKGDADRERLRKGSVQRRYWLH